jgi:hypothetical protein
MALVMAGVQAGCDDSGSENNGTGGMSGGTGGDSGTGGAGGGGGSTGGCLDERVLVDPDIMVDTTWPCNSYVLQGITAIHDGVTLTIEAGSTIYGDSTDTANPASLVAMRGGRLVAIGTKDKPIVFTSIFAPGTRVPGDSFGGVVLMGKAKINDGTCVNDTGAAAADCSGAGDYYQASIEGIAATDPRGQYGGTDDTWDCGQLKYVRIEFAGYLLGADNELNGLSVGACGSGTKVSYLQVHRGFDDGIETWGGMPQYDHIVITGATDDSFDWDTGFRGKVQFAILHQAYTKGDKGIEADNLGAMELAVPRSAPEMWNVTMIGETGKIGMHLREGTRAKLNNFIVQGFSGGAVDVDAKVNMPAMEWPMYLSIEHSIFFMEPLGKDETGTDPVTGSLDNDMGFDEAAHIMEAARMNQIEVDPMLGSTAVAAPNYVPGNTAAVSGQGTPPADGFFDSTATYAGAVAPGDADPWYAGWTAFPEN